MVFHTHETKDGNFELVLDDEGIDFLEDGLTELRRMQPGNAVTSPFIDEKGVGDFKLRRAKDA